VFTLSFMGKKVRFDRTALFYCKLRKQSVKDSGFRRCAERRCLMLAFLTVPKIMVMIVNVAMTLSQNLLQTAFSIYSKIKQSCQIEPSSRLMRE